MARARAYETPGWTRNLIRASRVEAGERVVVLVDEPLVEEGAQLLAALRDAGAAPRLELWTGERPLAHAPPGVLEALRDASLLLFLAQAARGDEAAARLGTTVRLTARGGPALVPRVVASEL